MPEKKVGEALYEIYQALKKAQEISEAIGGLSLEVKVGEGRTELSQNAAGSLMKVMLNVYEADFCYNKRGKLVHINWDKLIVALNEYLKELQQSVKLLASVPGVLNQSIENLQSNVNHKQIPSARKGEEECRRQLSVVYR